MKWSPQQEEALDNVGRWLRSDQQVYRLFGYAGTGKTTLAKHLAEGVSGPVHFAAYTGKAAQVLTTKGCDANTIHQLIYVPKHRSKARLVELQEQLQARLDDLDDLPLEVKNCRPDVMEIQRLISEENENMKRMMFQLNTESPLLEAGLLVVDECSMVDQQMGEDLLSFGCKILVLGDPAQLPPVKGGGFFTDCRPDFMLTEVHRQAKDSAILEMATRIRLGKSVLVGDHGDCRVHPRGTDMRDIAMAADQIICGTNRTRQRGNARMRGYLGHEGELPVAGDRMVCLRNNHDHGLLNGQIWIAAEDADQVSDDQYLLSAYSEDSDTEDVKSFNVWSRDPDWFDRKEAEEFDYGYCLTCHKSQGSQWDHVLVLDESAVFRRDRARWLYTAITRAALRLDIVLM